MKIFNTLTNQKEDFQPIKKGKVNMFVCGPTVYDYSHIGHARTYIVFDVIAKYLRYKKYKVKFLMNITDIDDKIINRAKNEGKTPKEIADFFEKAFFEDIKKIKITSISKFAKATDYIPQIIKQIKKLIKNGTAYAVPSVKIDDPEAVNNPDNLDVYFDISKFPEYGKLSKQNIEEVKLGVRVKTEENKRDPRDFVLWKAQNFKYEPAWKSPWGKGRPGWHIEDTAITEKNLGQQYDIHCGAQDLIFPHHEAEIAQQESASGKKPFVKYWLHSGLLTINGQKMSKSLGNFITIREILGKYSPEAIRFAFLSTHYRSPVDYSEDLLKQSEAAVDRIKEVYDKLTFIKKQELKKPESDYDDLTNKVFQKFEEKMDDDFNTPEALAALFNFIKQINNLIFENKIDRKEAEKTLKFLEKIEEILGIISKKESKIPHQIYELAAKRELLRREKKWIEADRIRNEIEKMGYEIEDTVFGPLIKEKS